MSITTKEDIPGDGGIETESARVSLTPRSLEEVWECGLFVMKRRETAKAKNTLILPIPGPKIRPDLKQKTPPVNGGVWNNQCILKTI